MASISSMNGVGMKKPVPVDSLALQPARGLAITGNARAEEGAEVAVEVDRDRWPTG